MNEIVGMPASSRTISNVPDGMQPMVLARLVEQRLKDAPDDVASLVFVARDGRRMQRMAEVLAAILPGHTILTLPAWDCLPYDRVSPNTVTVAARMNALAALAGDTKGAVVLTAVNALIQKLPPRDLVETMSFSAAVGRVVDSEKLVAWAANNGYLRVPTVRESGEFAVRGGLVDLYPAGSEAPLRFDFFGSQLESIRTFDPDSQRTTGTLKHIDLTPMSEVVLNEETIRRFRQNYTAAFGGNTVDDTLYASVSGGSRYSGTEHWLPFFYGHMDRLADYVGDAPFVFAFPLAPYGARGRCGRAYRTQFRGRAGGLGRQPVPGGGGPAAGGASGGTACRDRVLEYRYTRSHGAGAQGPWPDQSTAGGELARRRDDQCGDDFAGGAAA